MSSVPLTAERLSRLLSELRSRAQEAARTAVEEARPWLKRETWTRERLTETGRWARRNPRPVLRRLLLLAAPLLLVGLWLLGGGPPDRLPFATVAEGPFRVTIVESGTLQALRSVTYASQIQSNQAKIVAMAPEGKLVQKGDMLLLFDSAPFEEEIRKSEALLRQAQADLEKAQQDLKLQGIANREELAVARQKLERSELEFKDVSAGKGLLREEEAQAAVTNAERELQKAITAHEDLKPLLGEGFITKQELEKAEQQVAHQREELALAQRRQRALLDYGRPLELSQARAEATLSKEALKELAVAADSKLGQKRAAIQAALARIQELEAKLNLARQQLSRTEVRADVPGIVVYKDVFFGSEQRRPQVGDQVWANQPLLILPDISRMTVETKVRETDIHKVEKNQSVGVRVEAYPDLRLTGKVNLVGTLAQEEKERRGTKFFGVQILVNESEPRLRPGMTARVEIQVEERGRALSVPLDAVFEKGGRQVVYVLRGRSTQEREVALGPANQDFVAIERGLRRGERVALRDPEAPASDFGAQTAQ
ncbi:MAG TPA: efflux RND transporter periplasmic adaptor subunit [Vicinamibacteria bacterium]|nr:efflux RND transporter periplasmic adaptor subunit [Vicinamibacteria bacterium]